MRLLNSSRWLLLGWAAIYFINLAHAIDPNRAMSQYIHDQWGVEKGFPGGSVHAIAQTPDGYLWIGTDKGLVRFDGINFRLLQPSSPALFPAGPVLELATDGSGDLWVRLRGASVLRYHNGEFKNPIAEAGIIEAGVTAMCRMKDGTMLLSALNNGLLRYRDGKFEKFAPPRNSPGSSLVISLAQSSDGKIWMGTLGTGLLYQTDGPDLLSIPGLPDVKINYLLPASNGQLWIGTDEDILYWNGFVLNHLKLPSTIGRGQTMTMVQDRDANIWVGTTSGLLRINSNGAAAFDQTEYRSNGGVTALFEDREDNIWVGTARGVERIRDSVFVTYSVQEGMPSESAGPIYTDAEGRTWFAPSEGGLYWLQGTKIERINSEELNHDVGYSITGNKNELWIGRRNGGLTHLQYENASLSSRTYTQADGLAQNSVYAVHQSRDGTVWAGTLSGGLTRIKNGVFTTFTVANGLASNTVASILESPTGAMFFATANGLNVLAKGQWRTYNQHDGLPSVNLNCLFEDSTGLLWIGTADGLAFLSSVKIQVPGGMPELLRESILGISEDGSGWLWIATANHVFSVKRDALLSNAVSDLDVREYGFADGLHSMEGLKRDSSVSADSHGRIWFSMSSGLSVVDPAKLAQASAPAIVHVESISADNVPVDLNGAVRIPPARQRVTFHYAGLSLAIPERVKFRYMLEGFDHGWSDSVTTRDAIYTNLGAGSYRFRLIASNSNGMWNSAETEMALKVEPTFWQTWWFRITALLVCGLGVLLFYRLRLLQLTRQMNVRFEERLAERTRIAQELHDTLLQGFLSASIQLHVADEQLTADSPAKPVVSRVLKLMQGVIEEGRNAVRGLRSPRENLYDLDSAFSKIPEEIGAHDTVDFKVIVEGQIRPLNPLIRDEVYRIGREALVNAFLHSRADSIEIELEYTLRHLRILVRDDGCGIDPQVLRSGREGHWGLSGMRERAEGIGAHLKVWSRVTGGTEVDLSVPGDIAFAFSSTPRLVKWFARLYPRRTEQGRRKPQNQK